MHVMGEGLFRFGVASETAPVDWKTFTKVSGVEPATARNLVRAAKAVGASQYDWRCSFDPVPRSAWLAVERMEFPEHRWKRLTDEDIDAIAVSGASFAT